MRPERLTAEIAAFLDEESLPKQQDAAVSVDAPTWCRTQAVMVGPACDAPIGDCWPSTPCSACAMPKGCCRWVNATVTPASRRPLQRLLADLNGVQRLDRGPAPLAHVERLPGYAPSLNPVELLWGDVTSVELANLCPETIEDARASAEAELERAGTSSQLCFNFPAHKSAGPPLPSSGTFLASG